MYGRLSKVWSVLGVSWIFHHGDPKWDHNSDRLPNLEGNRRVILGDLGIYRYRVVKG